MPSWSRAVDDLRRSGAVDRRRQGGRAPLTLRCPTLLTVGGPRRAPRARGRRPELFRWSPVIRLRGGTGRAAAPGLRGFSRVLRALRSSSPEPTPVSTSDSAGTGPRLCTTRVDVIPSVTRGILAPALSRPRKEATTDGIRRGGEGHSVLTQQGWRRTDSERGGKPSTEWDNERFPGHHIFVSSAGRWEHHILAYMWISQVGPRQYRGGHGSPLAGGTRR